MLDAFWQSLIGDLPKEWLKRAFSPAFLFWMSGLGLYALRYGWQGLWDEVRALTPPEQIALLILLLALLVLSGQGMAHFRFRLLRLLEGYWPRLFGWLEGALIRRQEARRERAERLWNDLKAAEEKNHLSSHETRRLAELEVILHYYPAQLTQLRPTRLGNLLRAGETMPQEKYGLVVHVCWPRLWLLLPAAVRDDLSGARERLMAAVELWGWGALALVWSIWSLWAIPLALLWLRLAHSALLSAAMAYADLLEAAFDLYRHELYRALNWPIPEAENEKKAGQRLSEFFWRGT